MAGALQWTRQGVGQAAAPAPRRPVAAETSVGTPAAATPKVLGPLRGYNGPLGPESSLNEVLDAYISAGLNLVDDKKFNTQKNYGLANDYFLTPMVEAGVAVPHVVRSMGDREVRRFVHQDYGPGGLQTPQQAVEVFSRLTPGYGGNPEATARAIDDLAASIGVDPSADPAVKQAAVFAGVQKATEMVNKFRGGYKIAARHGGLSTGAALAAAAPEQRQQLLEAIGAQRMLEEMGGGAAAAPPVAVAPDVVVTPDPISQPDPIPSPGPTASAPPQSPPPSEPTIKEVAPTTEPTPEQPGWWSRKPIDVAVLRSVPNWAYVGAAGGGTAAALAALLSGRGQTQADPAAYSDQQAAAHAYY
jgi:outer membrane biosynthesis protein TonB